jgi:hypothetical protein
MHQMNCGLTYKQDMMRGSKEHLFEIKLLKKDDLCTCLPAKYPCASLRKVQLFMDIFAGSGSKFY